MSTSAVESPVTAGLVTNQEIASMTGKPVRSVVYAIHRAGLRPTRRIGRANLWSPEQVEVIKAAVAAIRPMRLLEPQEWGSAS